jgi:single-stranded DNA-binding protein
MNREVHVRFCERVGLRCPARLTYIEGRLTTRQYEAKDGSGKRYRTEIVARQLRLLGSRTNGNESKVEASDDIPF